MSVQALTCAFAVRGVSASEKLLLLALANYADPNMRCFPSHRTLSDDTGLSERTILSILKSLEAQKLVSRQERRRPDGSRSTDLITLHFAGEVIKGGGEIVSPRGETASPGVGKLTAGGGEMVSPLTTFEPVTNHQEEPSSEDKSSDADRVLAVHPDKVAWEQAVLVLTGSGKMGQAQARKLFGKILAEYGLQARDMLGCLGNALANSTQDPAGYLRKAALAKSRRESDRPPKRVGFV